MDGGALSPPWYPEGTPRRFTDVYPTKGACGPHLRKPKAGSGELVIFTRDLLMKLSSVKMISKIVEGAHFQWQTTLKGGRALGAALSRVLHLRVGGMTRRWYTATFQYAKYVVRLQRRSGWAYVVIYLKACSVLLQQSANGQRIRASQELGCAVSRTAGGIPRVIPKTMRGAIRSKDIWTVRVWLSFFALYRVIEVPGKLKLHTITSPSTMDPRFLGEWYLFLNEFFGVLLEIVNPKIANLWNRVRRSVRKDVTPRYSGEGLRAYSASLAAHFHPKGWERYPWDLRPRYMAIPTSGPNSGKSMLEGPGPNGRTSSGSVLTSALVWKHRFTDLYPFLRKWLESVDDLLIRRLIEFAEKSMAMLEHANLWDHEFDIPCFRPVDPRTNEESSSPRILPGFGGTFDLGKLGFKVEPAGKIRVFAMVDAITQMVMAPVHKLLFHILGKIPTDGTFDQLRPAKALIASGKTRFWSYDLSAATDRFPVELQRGVMALLLGHTMADLWVRLLVDRDYKVPRWIAPRVPVPKGTPERVRYGAGQPMGALTSWAAFSLTHHFLVQYAAYCVYGKVTWFLDYALLGDDIVLADKQVAEAYLVLLSQIGVEYGLAKSLISSTGGFEFAKRTFVCGKDASAISLLALGVAKADLSVLEQVLVHSGTRPLEETLRICARILGYGYRTLARLPAVLATRSRLQGLAVLLTRPGSPWQLPSVVDWLTQVGPGKVGTVGEGALAAMRESLEHRLLDSALRSLKAHLSALVEGPLHTGTPWERPSELGRTQDLSAGPYLEFWFWKFESDILRGMERELARCEARVRDLKPASLSTLDDVWSVVNGVREDISVLPMSRSVSQRSRLDFGGAKRSALLRTWRAANRLLKRHSVS
jgi:hypothetical protein